MDWSPIIMRLFDELSELRKEVERNELYRLSARVYNLKYSYKIFRENLVVFRNFATEDNLPPVRFPLNDPEYKDAVFDFQMSLSRHLFNMLSSAIMYVDHSITVKDSICKKYPEFSIAYESQVNSFSKQSDIFAFMKDIRRYLVHYSISTFSVHSQLQTGKINFESPDDLIQRELHLDDKRLLEWKGISAAGKRHIESTAGGFSFYRSLEKYDAILQETYQRFVKTFNDYFNSELQIVFAKAKRHDRIRGLLDQLTEHNRKQQDKRSGQQTG